MYKKETTFECSLSDEWGGRLGRTVSFPTLVQASLTVVGGRMEVLPLNLPRHALGPPLSSLHSLLRCSLCPGLPASLGSGDSNVSGDQPYSL